LLAEAAEGKLAHCGVLAVVRQLFHNRESGSAVGARYEEILVPWVFRVAKFREAFVAYGYVWRYNRARKLGFFGALDYCEFFVLVAALKRRRDYAVDLGERRLLLIHVFHEAAYALFAAFDEDFYACVALVAHVTCQAVSHGYAVDEGAKPDALNYARYVEFNAQ
jgi:hypothetical protein